MKHRPAIFATFSEEPAKEIALFQFHGAVAEAQEDGLIKKGILRTGHWPVTPTEAGKLKKPLTIVKEGKSDYDAGVIALSDIVSNFGVDGELVQVPLAQADQKDHTAKTINNTGFVRSVWIEDRPEWGDNQAELMGAFDFTKADVKAEVMAGTYADVSSGVPWVMLEDGTYSTKLDHVCITNKPFIKKMTGWLFADDDNVDASIATLETKPDANPADKPDQPVARMGFYGQRIKEISSALEGLNLIGYEVVDISDTQALVKHASVGKTWYVDYAIVGDKVLLAASQTWEVAEQENPEPPTDDFPTGEGVGHESSNSPEDVQASSELERAQQERARKHSRTNDTGGPTMGKNLLSVLEGVQLSDEQRAALEAADEEAARLRASSREGEATKRIDELKNLGVNMPGALKLYRKVFLSDDGGPAAVLMSDDGKESRQVKAVEILDLFIDACKGDQGTVQFSDQATDTGNNTPPPKDSSDEAKPLTERIAESRDFLKLGN